MTYTPQQNEAAEQMNRTLLERARAMLATTSLGKLFWVEAINTECYVINHSPSTVVKLKTPMKMWTRKTVNYSDLHIYGSLVKGVSLVEEGEPSTLQEALNNPDASFWKEAMQKEIKALHKNKTQEWCHYQEVENPLETNGCIKSREAVMIKWSGIVQDWWLKDMLIKKESTSII
ncbi:gag-pol polyprotein, partial [Tanacetum coccineum]